MCVSFQVNPIKWKLNQIQVFSFVFCFQLFEEKESKQRNNFIISNSKQQQQKQGKCVKYNATLFTYIQNERYYSRINAFQ